MNIGPDLRSFLLAVPDVAAIVEDRVFQNKVPQTDERQQDPLPPYIWLMRSGREDARTLDDPTGLAPFIEEFDVECCSISVDESIELMEAVRQALDNYAGVFGDSQVQYIEVQDQDDSYFPRNIEADIGINVSSLYVRIVPLYEV